MQENILTALINRRYHTTTVLGLSTLVFLLIMLLSCAQQSNRGPQGGPRDTTPPGIDSSRSTPNMQTRFSERKIELVFDEWIQTRNLVSKILISPPLQFLPRIQSRGKKITIEFNEEEVLKENATYIFNLGDAVSDFREGNKIDNFSFVFSTGDVIDSLSFSGTVVDAFTGKPIKDVYVMLYDITEDSIVYKQKPFYFVNTDKDGVFNFRNIRSDTFKLFALKDGNLNYTYDVGIEEAGFIDSLIYLTDTFDSIFRIELFKEEVPVQFSKIVSSNNGRIKLLFKNELKEKPEYTIEPALDIPYEEIVKDTFVLWYRDTMPLTLYVQEDTLTLSLSLNDEYTSRPIALARKILGSPTLSPRDSLTLKFTTPLSEIFIDSVMITDSSGTLKIIQAFVSDKTLKITGNWKNDSLLNVLIKPSGIRDIHGRVNDTLALSFKTAPIEKYGDVIFTIEAMDSNYNYVIDLLKGSEIISKRIVSNIDSTTITYNTLSPGQYSIVVLEDKNGDGRWNAGNYNAKSQSERMSTITLDALRENWELLARYNWKTKSKE